MHNWHHGLRGVKKDLDKVNLIKESNFNLELMKIKQDEIPIEMVRRHSQELFPA